MEKRCSSTRTPDASRGFLRLGEREASGLRAVHRRFSHERKKSSSFHHSDLRAALKIEPFTVLWKSGAQARALQTLREVSCGSANAKRLDCVRFTAAFRTSVKNHPLFTIAISGLL